MALRVIAEHTEGYGTAIAHSPREGVWATVAYSQFYLWRQENLLYSVPLAGHFGGSPQFSVDGETLYVGTRAFDLRRREFLELPPLDGALMSGLPPGSNARPDQFEINGSAWSADGQALVIHVQHRATRDPRITAKYNGPWKRLLLVNGETREAIATLIQTNTSEESTCIAINDKLIAAAGLSLRAWDRPGLSQLAQLEGFNVSFRDLRLNADGSLLVAPAWDGHVAIWDTRNWQRIGAWAAHDDFARCAVFHPTQPLIATGGGDTRLSLWRTDRPGRLLESLDLGARIEGLSFWPDGSAIAAAVEDGRLLICGLEP